MPLYMGPVSISLLNDGGFETVSYVYRQLTPTSISDLNLQYSASLGNFNTFSMTFAYNYYDVFAMDAEGRRVKVTTEMDPQIDFSKEILNTEKEPYVKK